MKKILTRLLILIFICMLATVVLSYFSIHDFSYDTSSSVMSEVEKGKETPGIGWYFLFAGGSALMVDFFGLLVEFFVVFLIPSGCLILILILQCIAWLAQIGVKRKWKFKTSIILCDISIVIYGLLCIVLLFNVISNLKYILYDLHMVLLILVFIINVGCMTLFIKEVVKIKKINYEL